MQSTEMKTDRSQPLLLVVDDVEIVVVDVVEMAGAKQSGVFMVSRGGKLIGKV